MNQENLHTLQFVYGRSGTGKSTYLYENMKEEIQNGSKIYMITPEQFSFQAEKRLMEITQGGSVSAEVLSFERMAHRIFHEVSGANNIFLSIKGRTMLLYQILTQQKENLTFLANSEENVSLITRQITELKKHHITTDKLKELKEKVKEPYLKLKIQDILTLYTNLESNIQNRWIDETDTLTMLAEKIGESKILRNAVIYIDEFSGFTPQEYAVITALMKVAKKMMITITTDTLFPEFEEENNLFALNKITAKKILECAKKTNREILPPIVLSENKRLKKEELKYLEEALCQTKTQKYQKEVKNISLFLANNPYGEIENVAKQIVTLVRDENYRYKDISIITQNIDTYGGNIKAIFHQYQIPVFLDEKKDVSSNPYIKHVLSLLEVFHKNYSYEAMFAYIKSGFLPIEKEDIYILENYCVKYGIKGNKWYKEPFSISTDEDLEKLNTIREKIMTPLLTLKSNFKNAKTTEEMAKVLYQFLTEEQTKEIVKKKIENREKIGDIDTASELSQALNLIAEVLEEMVLLFQKEKITLDIFGKLLRIGLKNSELGKIPMTLDQVIVGDIERSRTHKVKAVFVIGLNDGNFPSVNTQEGFINDKEREKLKEIGVELAKGTNENLKEEQYNIYKAFTQAEQKLFLSYSSTNQDGVAIRPSTMLLKIKRYFPKLKEESNLMEEEKFIGNQDTTLEDLLYQIRSFEDGKKIDTAWFQVYHWYQKNRKEKLKKALNGLQYTNLPERLSKEKIEKLYGETLQTSISRLEQYRKCPFSFHLKYGLKLTENSNFQMQPIDTGSFMHNVIEEFFEEIKEKKIEIKEITKEECQEIIEKIVSEKLHLNENYIFTSSYKFISLTKRLKRAILQSVNYIIEQIKAGDFSVLGTEIEFKLGKQYPPIVLETENGKEVEITGKIDRIDIAEFENKKYVRIIDYKSSAKDINLNEFAAGLQIQLITYLDAVTKIEDVLPAGVFYFNLMEPIINAERKLTDEEIKEEIRKKFKMKGLVLADINIIKHMDKNLESKASSIIPVYIDTKGNITQKFSSVATQDEFTILKNYANKIMKQIAKEILEGNVEVKPFYYAKNKNTPCQYCAYQSICGFNPRMRGNQYRYIQEKDEKELLETMKQELQERRKS